MDPSNSGGATDAVGHPDLGAWKNALHTPFVVHLDDVHSVELTLIEVEAFDRRPRWETFSLLFNGPSPPAFWQGTYPVEHPEVGSFPLFLVAVHTDEDGQHYEAIFNRRAA